MWCRFLTFCVLVSFTLFVVASCIYGRPSFHLFFHRCCGDDIENDQVIFENFGNNFLKERLVGGNIIEADSGIVFENEDIGRIADGTEEVSNINDPEVKKWIADTHISHSDDLDTDGEDKTEDEHLYNEVKYDKEENNKLNVNEILQKEVEDITELSSTVAIPEEQSGKEKYVAIIDQEKKVQMNVDGNSTDLLDKEAEEETETASRSEFLNVHDVNHKQIAKTV